MADEGRDPAGRDTGGRGAPDNPMTAFAQQLRDAADRMMSGWSALPGGAAPPPVFPPPPATTSARQLQTVLADLGARRAQVQALCAQLTAFDEQLAALEESLRPLHDWARTWAEVEQAATEPWRSSGG